ncbi:MAG TPA: hypothetical protein VGE08_17910 [Steroidobacter sp.]|uniref:NAD(P)H-dependent amine dehydrogenase family protein n=1 Tax=Steroidobacter sp. TaxID=1978227 RepID=UPI002EDBA455
MYQVVQWATGSIGRTALRRIIDSPDLQLVGLFVYDERKSGLDAGQIARRPPTGIRATHRIEDILALDADVVIHTPRLSNPYERQNVEVAQLLASGKNVISTAGFHFPDAHGPDYTTALWAACRKGRSTLAGLGLNPGFIAERLGLLITSMCARFESIATFEVADASMMPSREFVFDTMGLGSDPQAGDVRSGPLATLYGELYMEVFHHVACSLGTRVVCITPDHRVTLAPMDLPIAAGTIPRGTVAATDWRWNAQFANGQTMTHSVIWTADPTLHGIAKGQAASWRIEVRGRPCVTVTMSIEDPDPTAPHARASADATAALAINAIPAVCAAPPGFFAPRSLAKG